MNSHKPTIVSTATAHGKAPCFIMVCVPYMIWFLETANTFPLIHCALVTLVFLIFLNNISYRPVSGPLHVLFLLPGTVFPQRSKCFLSFPQRGLI